MNRFAQAVREHARLLPSGLVKVDGIVNHQVDPGLMDAAGRLLVTRLRAMGAGGVDRVLTAETSGIAPAYAVADLLGVPLVFARKRRRATMSEPVLSAAAVSRTGDGAVTLHVAAEFLPAGERVLLIDDFLGTGRTLIALAEIVAAAAATVVGIGCLLDKVFEPALPALARLGVPMVCLVRVDVVEGALRVRDGAD